MYAFWRLFFNKFLTPFSVTFVLFSLIIIAKEYSVGLTTIHTLLLFTQAILSILFVSWFIITKQKRVTGLAKVASPHFFVFALVAITVSNSKFILNIFGKNLSSTITLSLSLFALTAGLIILLLHKTKSDFGITQLPSVENETIFNNLASSRLSRQVWLFSLTIVFVLYTGITTAMLLIYDGNYFDEYFHIFSGTELFETGKFAEVNAGVQYVRGSYVSVLVGISMFLFGKTTLVAKLVPTILGFINFLLLFLLCRIILQSKNKYTILILLVYTFLPWVLVNHFYIRMYVFYEFFILLLSVILVLLVKNYKPISLLVYAILILSLVFFFSYDAGRVPVILFSTPFMFYSLFFVLPKLRVKNIFLQRLFLSNSLKIIFLLLIILVVFLFSDIKELLGNAIASNIRFSSSSDLKYKNLFFNLNSTLTILFLLNSFLIIFKKPPVWLKLFLGSSLLIFILHYLSPSEVQLTRAIAYFLPLYCVGSIFLFSQISHVFLKWERIAIVLLIVLNIIASYPPHFFKGPMIPGELNYIDNRIYEDVVLECQDSVIITSGFPGIGFFQGVDIDYFLNIQYKEQLGSYSKNPGGVVLETYSRVPIIGTVSEFQEVLNSNKHVCFFGGELPDKNVGEIIYSIAQSELSTYPSHYSSTRNSYFFIK